jgi:hypothetical protein
MSDITVINDSEQSSLVTNGLAKNGELYLKADGSTDAGAIVVYDSGSWRTFANEAVSFTQQYSVSLDGSNDYISLASQISFSGACTLSTWIKPSCDSDEIFLGQVATTSFYFYINNEVMTFVPKIGASGISASGFTVSNGSWYNAVIVRDASNNITIYINGVSRATGSYSGALATPGLQVNSYNFTGLVDEYAMWNSDQSSNISSIYNSGVPNDISSLSPLHWWRMGDDDSGSGTTITDQGSGGNDGTLTNGPTFSSDVPS